MVSKNFFLSHCSISCDEVLLKKIFVKYLYTQFLIYHISTFKKKKLLLLDNYLTFFNIKVKKKYKYLKRFRSLKVGIFFRGNLFVFKHSKLKFHFFISVRAKKCLKRTLYFTLNTLSAVLKKFNTLFLYRNVRGGFLAISNKVVGYISKNLLYKSKKKLFKYKKYYLLTNMSCLSNLDSGFKSLIFYHRTTSKILKSKFRKKRGKRKKLKFFFNSIRLFYRKLLCNSYALATWFFKSKLFQFLDIYYSLMFSKILKFLFF